MHIIKALTTSFALVSLASCLDDTELSLRSWTDPISPETLNKRQGVERLVQIVQVGDNNGSLKFFPEKVTAEVGSVIQFQFYPKNHTITESTFAAPCVPIAANLTTPMRPGQKSGFVPVTADTQFRPVYNLIVNDTKPMWIFCGQMPHCQKGMAMVINQNASTPEKTIEKYKQMAAALPLPSASAASSPPAYGTPAPTSAASVTTVTPVAATNSNGGGPSLIGSKTSASIATFTGGANGASAHRGLPAALAVGLLAAGLAL